MSLRKEIRELEAKGVFIHLQHEHYANGSNCVWAIEILDLDNKRIRKYHTSWYGDNHEFGDTIDCYEAAFRLAKFLLEGDNAEWFFIKKIETVTPEGYARWLKHQEVNKLANEITYKILNNKAEDSSLNHPKG